MTDPASSLHTQTSLLVRLRDARDTESWQTFVTIYGPLIYRYCRRKGLQDADAADVGQEVLTQVARSMSTFEYQRERGRFRDWLGTVTRHKIGRCLEKKQRGAQAAGGEQGDDVLDRLPAPEAENDWTVEYNARVLQAALERIRWHFEPATWRAFELAWREQRPAAEAAQELDLPIEAVYWAKSRVLKRLREEILLLAEDLP
jgi:RNA polymerase sigma-70 factor (ECF subfamily)